MNGKSRTPILIIGRVPPPIGGVTVHVSRLLDLLSRAEYPFTFIALESNSLASLFYRIPDHRLIHLHTSNSVLKFAVSVFCKLTSRKLVTTFHGNIGRFGIMKNLLERASIRLADTPVTLNESSFRIAVGLNRRARLMSSYIPPNLETEPELDSKWRLRIADLAKNHAVVACTNAFDVSFTAAGEEVYRISEIVTTLSGDPEIALVLSDPSGRYLPFLKDNGIEIAGNVMVISEQHSFVRIIERSHVLLRLTRTDGDSLSVKEALDLGIKVLASDVVSRPEGVHLFDGVFETLSQQIRECLDSTERPPHPVNGGRQLMALYGELDAS